MNNSYQTFLVNFLELFLCILMYVKQSDAESFEIIETGVKPIGVAVLTHGLNNKPSVMSSLAEFLREVGFHSLLVTLPGHSKKNPAASGELWTREVVNAMNFARSKYRDLEILPVGFSAGTLASLLAIIDDKDLNIKKSILLAPPISLRWYTNGIKPFLPLHYLGLPVFTLAPKEYRLYKFPSLSLYNALYDLRDRLDEIKESEKLQEIKSLVFLSPKDEFISHKSNIKWIRTNFPSWKIVEIRPEPEIQNSWEHLIIDQMSLGLTSWNKMKEDIKEFLE